MFLFERVRLAHVPVKVAFIDLLLLWTTARMCFAIEIHQVYTETQQNV